MQITYTAATGIGHISQLLKYVRENTSLLGYISVFKICVRVFDVFSDIFVNTEFVYANAPFF